MADMIPQGTQEVSVPFGHESADANVRTVFISVLVLLSFAATCMLAMAGMFSYLNNREKAKDVQTPALFSKRELPPGPPLLPSPQRDELPWQAYQNERRAQEADAAKAGIIDLQSGDYKAPGEAYSKGDTTAYFKSKAKWNGDESRYQADATGGWSSSGKRFRGMDGSSAEEATRDYQQVDKP